MRKFRKVLTDVYYVQRNKEIICFGKRLSPPDIPTARVALDWVSESICRQRSPGRQSDAEFRIAGRRNEFASKSKTGLLLKVFNHRDNSIQSNSGFPGP